MILIPKDYIVTQKDGEKGNVKVYRLLIVSIILYFLYQKSSEMSKKRNGKKEAMADWPRPATNPQWLNEG